jgi:hypothetical protein
MKLSASLGEDSHHPTLLLSVKNEDLTPQFSQRSLLQIESSASLRSLTPAMATTLRTSVGENSVVSATLSNRCEGTQVPIAAILVPLVLAIAIIEILLLMRARQTIACGGDRNWWEIELLSRAQLIGH